MTRILVCVLVVAFAGIAHADQADRKRAERLFRIGEKAYKAQNFEAAAVQFEDAYKILPLPEIAFSAAQAYRRQFRVTKRLELAKRAAELYQVYLDNVKTGGRVGDAADYLESMERELAKAGGAVKAMTPTATADRTTLVINPELGSEPATGAMREVSDEDDKAPAIVTLLDGKPVEPYERIEVAPGQHEIRVEADGFESKLITERVIEGVPNIANITLAPKPARVTLDIERGTRVRVDGEVVGTAPLSPLELPAGRHVIGLSRDGREPVRRELTVERGQEVALREPLDKTVRRRAVPWVAGAAGALLVISGVSFAGALYYDGKASDQLEAIERTGDRTESDLADYRSNASRRDQLVTATWLGAGAAVLVGGAAAAMYWFDSRTDDSVRVTPAMTQSGAGVSIGGRF